MFQTQTTQTIGLCSPEDNCHSEYFMVILFDALFCLDNSKKKIVTSVLPLKH